MRCNNVECTVCPYGKEDYERRTSWFPDDPDTYDLNIWCDKVGGKYGFGDIVKMFIVIITNPKPIPKRKEKQNESVILSTKTI